MLITVVKANVYFQQVGWVNPAPAYGHIHMTVDTDKVSLQIKEVSDGISMMKKAVDMLTHPNAKRRASSFFEKWKQKQKK